MVPAYYFHSNLIAFWDAKKRPPSGDLSLRRMKGFVSLSRATFPIIKSVSCLLIRCKDTLCSGHLIRSPTKFLLELPLSLPLQTHIESLDFSVKDRIRVTKNHFHLPQHDFNVSHFFYDIFVGFATTINLSPLARATFFSLTVPLISLPLAQSFY